jgi:hypothetical protein
VTTGDARHLAWLRDELGDRFVAGAVFHTGPHAFPLGDRITALPISAIWAALSPRWPVVTLTRAAVNREPRTAWSAWAAVSEWHDRQRRQASRLRGQREAGDRGAGDGRLRDAVVAA